MDLGEPLPMLPLQVSDLQEYAVVLRYETVETPPALDREQVRAAVSLLEEFVRGRFQSEGLGS